jgi:O-antigen ligase
MAGQENEHAGGGGISNPWIFRVRWGHLLARSLPFRTAWWQAWRGCCGCRDAGRRITNELRWPGALILLGGTVANEFSVSRAHYLTYGLALPLAVLLGYFLAEPLGPNLLVIVFTVGLLAFPLVLRWYHVALVTTWNMSLIAADLPGRLGWWMFLAFLGFMVVLISRCVDARRRLMVGGAVPKTLLLIALVVAGTAVANGGIGLRSLGGETYGGRYYFFVAFAIMGYFALATVRIPPRRAMLYTCLFIGSSLTSALSELSLKWPALMHIVNPPDGMGADNTFAGGLNRIVGLSSASSAVCLVLMAYYGATGLLNYRYPWRIVLFAGALFAGMFSGFRSGFGALIMTFGCLFWLQGLYRTRHVFYLLAAALVGGGLLIGNATRLPLSVQRTISFLPLDIHPAAKGDADASIQWREEMWAFVKPQLREHLFLGKGYGMSSADLYLASVNAYTGRGISAEVAAVAGDYHNGPLSVLIPFGIWGAIAMAVFMVVCIRQLFRYVREGAAELRGINQFLLAYFLTRCFFFLFLVGGFHGDLAYLIGIIGLAVALNGELAPRSAAQGAREEGFAGSHENQALSVDET